MGIRRTYHFNCDSAGRRDGIYFKDPTDLHFRQAGSYDDAPYGIDCDSTTFLSLGDRPGHRPNSASFPIDIIGSIRKRFRTVNTTTAPDVDDYAIFADTTGGGVTINLPAISTVPRIVYLIKNIGPLSVSNLVTINRAGADQIGATTTFYLSAQTSVYLFADSTANQWRIIAARPRVQEIYKNLAGPAISTNSGSYATMATSGSIFFRGVPTLFIFSTSARDVNGSDEWWKLDYALRFDSGSDQGIGGLTNNHREQHEHATVSAILTPPAGLHTVSMRWKRYTGSGTITMDINDQLILNAIEI